MENNKGENVDLYTPRKWYRSLNLLFHSSWTNRLITSKDKGSVQINVAHIDPKTGIATGEYTPIALSGYIRSKGEGDLALNELVSRMPKDTAFTD